MHNVLLAISLSTMLVNGRWFDGQRFVVKTMYVQDGVFVAKKPKTIDNTIDLAGKFVVPPFAEAHNHNVSPASIPRYLNDGVFYVKNPNSLPRVTALLAGKINVPASIDAVFANGGLTSSDGHPVDLVSPRRGFKEGDGDGAFYYAVDSAADLDAKWPALLASKPDFVKAYLLYSEDYAARHGRAELFGSNGLDPALLPEIVRRAHAAGLRVSVHIETAADFRTAVAAGADEINHLPGFRAFHGGARFQITPADAVAAARRGVVVVTTLTGLAAEMAKPDADPAARAVVTSNLRVLKDAGVTIAIGSDSYGDTSRAEVDALRALGVFTDLELLKMWSETTPLAIYPKRRIGRLAPGYEASFLALLGDPLSNFANTRNIAMRMKQGVTLGQ